MRTVLIIVVLMLVSWPSLATIYYWTDEKGVVHIRDNLKDVPERYRGKTKKIEETMEEEVAPAERVGPAPTPSVGPEDERLYGGQSLEWWKDRFVAKRRQLGNIRRAYEQKKRFVEVFEKGRQFGKTFTDEEIETYRQYKEELAELEQAIEKAEEELEELKRKARFHGVPRSIRGE